jgi:hypothetical protein
MSELRSSAANFSLTQGGPSYRLEQRLEEGEDNLTRVRHRALGAVLIAWLPLLLLALAQGLAYGKAVSIPFSFDFAVNVRFLISLPLLILSEIGIDYRWRNIVFHFIGSGVVQESELPRFEALLGTITRLRDHSLPEVIMLVLAFIPSLFIRHGGISSSGSTWHFISGLSGTLSLAGWWFVCISAPLFRFLMARWLWREFLWALFLWRVSRLDLLLMPTHGDAAGGLDFVAEGQTGFSPIVFAGGAAIAAEMANAIAYEGASLSTMTFTMIGYCAFAIILLVAPLLLVTPKLFEIRQQGLLEYGNLATDYALAFESKWIYGEPLAGEPLLASSDIKSLADISNSFAAVREMSIIPANKRTFLSLAVAALLPMVPMLILARPPAELVRRVLNMLF